MSITVDKVVKKYLDLRAKKAEIEAELKAKTKELNETMSKLEAWIKVKADEEGVTSFKTKYGTAFLTTTDYAQVADWDATLAWIKDNEAYDMLEKRVSKAAVRGYIEANNSVPPGVNYGTKLGVSVRKPTN